MNVTLQVTYDRECHIHGGRQRGGRAADRSLPARPGGQDGWRGGLAWWRAGPDGGGPRPDGRCCAAGIAGRPPGLHCRLCAPALIAGVAAACIAGRARGWCRRPSARGWCRRPSARGWCRRPSARGWCRRPSARGWCRRPSARGWCRRPPAAAGVAGQLAAAASPAVLPRRSPAVSPWLHGRPSARPAFARSGLRRADAPVRTVRASSGRRAGTSARPRPAYAAAPGGRTIREERRIRVRRPGRVPGWCARRVHNSREISACGQAQRKEEADVERSQCARSSVRSMRRFPLCRRRLLAP